MKNKIQKLDIFSGQEIRRFQDEEKEKWYFSVVDVVAALNGRLNSEGSEVVTNCDHLRMKAMDGKYYMTDAADTETIFRLIQSI